ncbi:pyridine nucleotide-disulfide oxidoreductase [Prauserella sp. PE36]|uniref:NAD(P)/FAD-dependent oxidoreductase n=1 Tax=Prauserella sp. PE36 TaxID=1504709 RepID=UPI000D814C15|nr:FAD-dependent oxidoreductase [Prauserella sp. PE36]PXY30078.1 pyridine nucleotide-disulfide oxidoreductase [Prauserella coralliicola]RBM12617.1 pyridine nucleotide-disulfide oxidoreductase [Prauserella sp. PE36]
MLRTVVVAGAGQAAAVAARTLRRRGFDGRIELVGDEFDRPYQRPPLSKEYLENTVEEGLWLLTEQWCEEQDVRLRLGTSAVAVEPGLVRLADGTGLPADAVLIATGGSPRTLPGVAGEHVHTLRTRADADRLRERLRPGARIVIAGAGFLGSELAATARARGADVVVLDPLEAPLLRVVGAELGGVCAELHRANGVRLRLGDPVESVAEGRDGIGVRTASGERLEADALVVAAGIVPATEIAERSGVAVDNGILVDPSGRTSLANVYAAGDVANHEHPLFGERIRAEHVESANRLATVVADTMLGRQAVFADPHWCWSDQYGVNLQFAGHAAGCDEIVVRGTPAELDFCAFFLRAGVPRAAFAAERGTDVMAAKELIAQAAPVDPAVLRDEDTDLFDLAMEGVS